MISHATTLFPRRVIATMMIVFFGDLALRSDMYTTGSYRVPDEIMPLKWWGIILLAAGLVMVVTKGKWPIYIATTIFAAWCGALVEAVVLGYSPSPAGSAWLIGVVVLLVWSAGRNEFTK